MTTSWLGRAGYIGLSISRPHSGIISDILCAILPTYVNNIYCLFYHINNNNRVLHWNIIRVKFRTNEYLRTPLNKLVTDDEGTLHLTHNMWSTKSTLIKFWFLLISYMKWFYGRITQIGLVLVRFRILHSILTAWYALGIFYISDQSIMNILQQTEIVY